MITIYRCWIVVEAYEPAHGAEVRAHNQEKGYDGGAHTQIDIYNEVWEIAATSELRTEDVVLMIGGGHGFRMIEDTIFMEIE